jgi:hypothetical protein
MLQHRVKTVTTVAISEVRHTILFWTQFFTLKATRINEQSAWGKILAEQKLTINLFLMKKRRNYWFPKF